MHTILFPRLRRAALAVCLVAPAACDKANPAELRTHATTFPVRANWNASAAPVGPAAVRAALTVKEYLGSRMDAAVTLTGGAPTTHYQWRIFRGDCATTAVAASSATPTGLLLVATVESYPDIATNAGGSGAAASTVAGALDSLTAYSVRIRPAQTATSWNGTSPIACGNLQRSGGG